MHSIDAVDGVHKHDRWIRDGLFWNPATKSRGKVCGLRSIDAVDGIHKHDRWIRDGVFWSPATESPGKGCSLPSADTVDRVHIKMDEIYKTYNNNPPHLFKTEAKYFITGSTYKRKKHLLTNEIKQAVVSYLFKSFSRFGWYIEDWVLLDNHYHVLAEAPTQAVTLSNAINNFHKFSALWIKRHSGTLNDNQRIWFNYYDTCITYEKSYFARINYIWFNPVKHGYVLDPGDWKYGSYYFRKHNNEPLEEHIISYPWDHVRIEDDY